jgi:hypothetical protein
VWTGWTEITADNDDLTAWLADNADALQKLRQAHSLRHVPALRDTDEPELGPGHFVEQARYVRQAVAVFGPAFVSFGGSAGHDCRSRACDFD